MNSKKNTSGTAFHFDYLNTIKSFKDYIKSSNHEKYVTSTKFPKTEENLVLSYY